MNARAEFFHRVRFATMVKSAEALREQDGREKARALLTLLPSVDVAKALEDTARSGVIPTKYKDDPTFFRAVRYQDADKAMRYSGGRVAIKMINNARALAEIIIRFKSMPKGQAKALERAAKPFMSVKQVPRKLNKWFIQNEKNVEYLINAYVKWPDKGDDSPDKYAVGPFEVHNTLQLEGDDLKKTNKVIESSAKFIRNSGIPGANKTLYGDVFVVGKLSGHNTLAWYNIRDDNVYLRPLLKADMDAAHSLTHELGHRYWFKFLPKDVQLAWRRYHAGKRYENPDVGDQIKEIMATIKPGQPMPLPIKGWSRGGPPIVVGLENTSNPRRAEVVFEMPRGAKKGQQGRLKLTTIADFLGSQASRKISYPTAYAATSAEEHFAESFALYAMKKLTGVHKENFEKIIVNR